MSRRALIFVALLMLVLASVIGALSWALLSDPINPWAKSRIQIGMSEGDVRGILGRTSDREYHPWDIAVFMQPTAGSSPEWEKMWVGQEWMILVHFDATGKVAQVGCGDKDFDNPPPKTISRWLWSVLGY